jgi:hypothetical protein
MRMRQLVTFGELSNDIDTTGTGCRVAISSLLYILVLERNMDINLLHEKEFGSWSTN